MKTPILTIKTLVIMLPLLLLNGELKSRTPTMEHPSLVVNEPLKLKLLKIRHQVQRGQIILLQNSIESKLK